MKRLLPLFLSVCLITLTWQTPAAVLADESTSISESTEQADQTVSLDQAAEGAEKAEAAETADQPGEAAETAEVTEVDEAKPGEDADAPAAAEISEAVDADEASETTSEKAADAEASAEAEVSEAGETSEAKPEEAANAEASAEAEVSEAAEASEAKPEEAADAEAETTEAETSGAETAEADEEALADAGASKTGKCSDYNTWAINTATGVLAISGSGYVPPVYMWDGWDYADSSLVTKLIIGKDIAGFDTSVVEFSGLQIYEVAAGSPYFKTNGNVLFRTTAAETSLVKMAPAFSGSCTVPSDVTRIEPNAFANCVLLESLTLNPELQTIGHYAFMACEKLTNLTIPAGVTYIGYGAFISCYNLKSVTLPAGISSVTEYMFADCPALTSVNIPSSVTSISYWIFSGCTSLKKVDIPSSVNSIDYSAFAECGITEINFKGNAPTFGDGCFGELKATAYYPAGNSTWTAAVRQNYGGTITWKTSGPAINVPAAVTNLKAVSAGKNRVTLSWKASSGAVGYLIYAQKDGKYAYAGMTKGTSFTDAKALGDYNYYWVFPYVTDSSGQMYPGSCPKYVFAKGVCLPVTNLKAAAVKGGVKLSWTASAGAEGYLVYGIVGGKPYGYVGMTSGTSFIDKKASSTNYNFYWIYPYFKDANGKMWTGAPGNYTYGKAIK